MIQSTTVTAPAVLSWLCFSKLAYITVGQLMTVFYYLPTLIIQKTATLRSFFILVISQHSFVL